MTPVLQSRLPHTPWADPAMRRLPGIQPAVSADAFQPDDAYAGQMALRDRFLAERPGDVLTLEPGAEPAAAELLETALVHAGEHPGFVVGSDHVIRPDGVAVPLNRAQPLLTLAAYDADLGKRVQRLFDALQPGRALWRANAHLYEDPDLWAPRREADQRPAKTGREPYIRSERQVLFRLPDSGAAVFSIHTFVVPVAALDAAQAAALAENSLGRG